MRIALDARTATAPKTGDRTYCLNLIRALSAVNGENEYLLCTAAAAPTLTDGLGARFKVMPIPASPAWTWTPVHFPMALRRMEAALAHVQYFIPPIAPCPVITTIHDVSFRRHPGWFPPKHRALLNLLIPAAARGATRVIVGSGHARDELIHFYDLPPEKIAVTPYAADPLFRPMPIDEAKAAVRERFGVRGAYLLAVGVLQPRKNLPRLVRAFARIVAQFPHRLLLVGKEGWAADELRSALAAPGLAERVHFTGYVADADLPVLYAAADLFVYPSLYEGFGLPTLEAMACGTPVLTSTTSSLPEVVGDAAVMVDPTDEAAIARSMADLLGSPAWREELRGRGVARAKLFSWEETARQTLAVYREAVETRD
jgi:glycosyltransferase involved in cell wall biosynthesis